MKKAANIILMFLFCLNLAVAAYADEEQNESADSSGNQTTIVPNFTVTYSNLPEGVSVPSDEGSFLCEPVSGYYNPDDSMLSFGTSVVNGAVITVPFVFPDYTEIGEYRYSITQNAGSLMGVTYDNIPFVFCVLVGYGENGSTGVVATGAGNNGISDGKKIGFENNYNSGSLNVTNTVSGNIGDRDKDFTITILFSIPEEKTIENTITYSGSDGSPQTIPASAWSANGSNKTVSVTIRLKSSETAVFSNVPAGVIYTVTPAQEEGYTQTISPGPGTISAGSSAYVGITNKMDSSLNTGIVYHNIGYILIFAAAMIGSILLLRGNRHRGKKKSHRS